MGTSQSKLEELSVDDVSSYVTQLGAKYEKYGDAIAENAVDGEVLTSIDAEEEIKDVCECLSITNFLHQKVLIKEWHKAKATNKRGLQHADTEFTAASLGDASELTMDTALSTHMSGSGNSSPRSDRSARDYVRRVPLSPKRSEQGMPRTPTGPLEVPPFTISLEHQRAIEPLQLPKDDLEAGAPPLAPFRQIAKQAVRECGGTVGETNLVDISHFENRKGVNNLASEFGPEMGDMPPMRCHYDQPDDLEICRRFVLAQTEDYYEEYIPLELAQSCGLKEASRYYGHVIKMGNLRVGNICCIVEERHWANVPDETRRENLKILASVMEQQLERRQFLLNRNAHLRQDIEQLKNAGVDPVLEPPFGPVKAVLASQVSARQSLFPYPQEPASLQDSGYPTSPLYNRRSASLPAWHFTRQASEAERSHLHPSYHDQRPIVGLPEMGDPTPIGKHDMERVAMVNSLQILQMDPLSPEAQTIQSLLDMTGTLLGADFVFISVMDHEHRYVAFPTYPQGQLPAKTRQFFQDTYTLVQRHPTTHQPFVWRAASRKGCPCDYAVMTPHHQSFVVHDVAKDQSLAHYKHKTDVGFYSGSPIVLRGYTVAVLCCACIEARPDFGRAQELQQEQLAHLIAQQYDTWSLKREMQKLERERNMLRGVGSAACGSKVSGTSQDIQALAKMRSNRPEDYAALVFTQVQGVNAMREEANAEVVNGALDLHSRVLRTKIAEHGGYEVEAEGSGFQVAFSDVVDAVKFCLQAQEALYVAPWEEDILSLSEACEDASKCFRGLRVGMAIHCGDVDSATSQMSGQVSYSGETLHIAKSLEAMTHGGQILVTSDVWNIALQVVESTLGSPQVIDLGTHVMPSKSSCMQDGITNKSVLQLVPKSLAYDYLQSRQSMVEDPCASDRAKGRVFPAIKTKKSVSASFHDAPFEGNNVSMISVDTSEVEGLIKDSRMLLVALSNRIATVLLEGCHSGYQCQDFLIAFGELSDAVRFGLALQDNLGKENILDVSLKGKVRIGVQEGAFEAMGPNPISGKAEYSGKVVSCVPLIAEAAAPGSVYLGEEATDMDEFNLMPITNGFMLDFSGRRSLQGVEEEFSLYKCHPCKSWYDQMVDNRRCNLSQPWR